MVFTVLGRYGPFPAPGGACSCYLLEGPVTPGDTQIDSPKKRIVMDLGAGSLARLIALCPLKDIDAIILTHLHSDHMSDMLVLRYALQQLHARGVAVPMPLDVIAPGKPDLEFKLLASMGTFNMIKAEDGLKMRFGAMNITLHRMMHPVPSYAIEILEEEPAHYPVYGKDPLKKRMIYTGDTGMNPDLLPLCMHASFVLADAGLMEKDSSMQIAPHLTPKEAGELARNAGIGKLMLTHIWGGGVDEEMMLKQAKTYFPATEIAMEMHTYKV